MAHSPEYEIGFNPRGAIAWRPYQAVQHRYRTHQTDQRQIVWLSRRGAV
jgi:hypothetical protein